MLEIGHDTLGEIVVEDLLGWAPALHLRFAYLRFVALISRETSPATRICMSANSFSRSSLHRSAGAESVIAANADSASKTGQESVATPGVRSPTAAT